MYSVCSVGMVPGDLERLSNGTYSHMKPLKEIGHTIFKVNLTSNLWLNWIGKKYTLSPTKCEG